MPSKKLILGAHSLTYIVKSTVLIYTTFNDLNKTNDNNFAKKQN